MTVRIAIGGILGRMGQEILAASQADDRVCIVGGVVRPGADRIGNGLSPDIRLVADLDEMLPAIDAFVDFSTPEGTVAHARACATAGRPIVTGVTGLSSVQMDELQEAARLVPVLHARNMSVGLNTVLRILPALVQALDGYDVEIVETHHRHKTDAPSGTALALGEVIARARHMALADNARYGRHGAAPRAEAEIGIHAVRVGGNAGEHVVLFADEGEEVRIAHRAFSRRTYANGALRAARFLVTQDAGLYTMADVTSV